MVDFTKIHGFNKGQYHSFEELVCQLASREDFPDEAEFKRVEGSGGDGGVEAFWENSNGKETGYQAKFFCRPSKIKWNQLDESVQQALKTHPKLERYVIALPRNLTNKPEKQTAKGEWQHWEAWKKQWKTQAKDKCIEFVLWDETKLISLLIEPRAEGIEKYFFGSPELSMNWFRDQVDGSVFELADRYHPEDHVNIRVEKLFSAISHATLFKNEILTAIEDVKKFHLTHIISKLNPPPGQQLISEWEDAFLKIDRIIYDIKFNIKHKWEVESWKDVIGTIIKLNEEILKLINDNIYNNNNNRNDFDVFNLKSLQKNRISLEIKLDNIRLILSSKYIDAEQKKFAFISGISGSGKSHLLATSAKNALSQNQPVILLLGQNIDGSPLLNQMLTIIDIKGLNFKEFLKALDVAGEVAGVRTLLLIDAINEGVGSKYWFNNIRKLIFKLNSFKHICCVVSCRSECIESSVPEKILSDYPVFKIKGFETLEEQQLAFKIYLDNRGIARPSTPWLAPEFTNPLFLRTVCLALEFENKHEFPVGLDGTSNMFKFYYEIIAKVITQNVRSGISIYPKIIQVLDEIAVVLLANKQDFIETDHCISLISDIFIHMNVSTASDWLTVFTNEGLLRADKLRHTNGKTSSKQVIRFGFQRFQDFKMAEMALLNVSTTNNLFDTSGGLAFCFDGNDISSEWIGLMHALGVIIPEKYSHELVDVLPNVFNNLSNHIVLKDIFIESVKWRNHESFSDRTLELFNDYCANFDTSEFISLLLQFSVSFFHPWNAKFLHRNLIKKNISDRDNFWTIHFNYQSDYIETSTNTLIDWSLYGQEKHTNIDNQFLAALTLCWLFTSSNRFLRDTSTKALSNLLIFNLEIFPKLLIKFADIDDLYILERLLAAAYGACCLTRETERLKIYSEIVFVHIFKSGSPPFSLLLRDYALGILELANFHSSLPKTVNLNLCYPPYNSSNIHFAVSIQQLQTIVKTAGDELIFNSVTGSSHDFGNHIISPRVRNFIDNQFFATPINNTNLMKMSIIDIKYWIANRAYDYGWTKDKFDNDCYHHLHQINNYLGSPIIERIGKKYQWLALDEFLSRFADNYLIHDQTDNLLKPYSGPKDISSIRDIDPTILTAEFETQHTVLEENKWAFEPHIILEKIKQGDLTKWPSLLSTSYQNKESPIRNDNINDQKWLVLDEYQSKTEKYEGIDTSIFLHDSRMLEFRYITSIFINLSDAIKIANKMIYKQEIIIHEFFPSEVCNEGFLYETPWRNTWDQNKFISNCRNFPAGVKYVSPAMKYKWEHHLDESFSNGGGCYIPSPWLAKTLKLSPDLNAVGQWKNQNDEVVFRQFNCNINNFEEQYSLCLLRYDKADELMKKHNLTHMSLLVNERDSWIIKGSSDARSKRVDSLIWKDNNGFKKRTVRKS